MASLMQKTKQTNSKLTKVIHEIVYNRVILIALEDISYFHSLFEFQLYNVYYNPLQTEIVPKLFS